MVGFFIWFGLAAGQVGLTSQQLQKYGNTVYNYPNAQTKHVIGLLLFSGIASLLIALGSPYLPLFFLAFVVFSMLVIDIVGQSRFRDFSSDTVTDIFMFIGAGLLNHQLPLGGNFSSDSNIYKGLEGVSWAKFAVGLILFAILIADAVMHSKRQQKRHYVYGQ
jgi:hypothetical protein